MLIYRFVSSLGLSVLVRLRHCRVGSFVHSDRSFALPGEVSTVLTYSHPAGGYLELITAGDLMVLHCHWPLDLKDDEWIDIQNDYPLSDYLRAVDSVLTTGRGTVKGVTGGFLTVVDLDDGFAIEVAGPQNKWFLSSLRLHVRQPAAEFFQADAAAHPQFAAHLG